MRGNYVDVRHDQETKAKMYEVYSLKTMKHSFAIFGEKFRDFEHFEEYVLMKCKRAFEFYIKGKTKLEIRGNFRRRYVTEDVDTYEPPQPHDLLGEEKEIYLKLACGQIVV